MVSKIAALVCTSDNTRKMNTHNDRGLPDLQDSSAVAVYKSLIVLFLTNPPQPPVTGRIIKAMALLCEIRIFFIQKKTMTYTIASHLEAEKIINCIIIKQDRKSEL